jgi:PucR family transcriptional regulator, purine catabolism regulatory protein
LRTPFGGVHNTAMLILGDLLGHEAFGLKLLAGKNDEALARPLAGVHNSDMPEPTRFLPRDWMMLTLGLRLRNTTTAQRELIAELDQGGICALGFGVGVAFKRLPVALLEEADARRFPVVEIPFETPYREIVGFVNRSLLSSDFRTLHRSLSMQNYLMDALREGSPVDALVARLGNLLDSTVLLYAADGRLEAASGEAPVERIWQEAQTHDPGLHRALLDGSDIVSVPIGKDPSPMRWLVVVSRRRSIPDQLALSVIHSAERLLELVTLSRRAVAAEERVVRAELLALALEPRGGYDAVELQARIRRFDIDFSEPVRIVAFKPLPAHKNSLDRARLAMEALLADASVPYLMSVREPCLIALLQVDPSRINPWVDRLAKDGLHLAAGGGRAVESVDSVPQSMRDAELALHELEVFGERSTQVLLFEDLSLASWLMGVTPSVDLHARATEVIEPLLEHPLLYETLRTYLRERMNVAATARAMFLHHNSLRYRLARIEELLCCSLRDLPTLVDLYLATLVKGSSEEAGARPPTSGDCHKS